VLTITVPGVELYDEKKEVFFNLPEVTLSLEHSLVSLSKWESHWEKPFLGPEPKTTEETIGYVKAMTLTPNIPDEIYGRLSNENLLAVNAYIGAKMSATWFNEQKKPSREIVTAEVIYSWLVNLQIDWECQHWHLNRLFTLIKVVNQKNAPDKQPKRSRAEMIAERNALNAKRRAELNTSG
jgi:hypothetical protein